MTLQFKLSNRDSKELVVFLSPMDLPADKLPHFSDSTTAEFSTLLVNPANRNFYLDCLDELCELIKDSQQKTGASSLIFCGSSMGGYGALLLGALFKETTIVVAYAPCLRIDHPGSLSEQNVDRSLLTHPYNNLIPLLDKSDAKMFIYFPCIDRQDGIHIQDAIQLKGKLHRYIYVLLCEHDIHKHISLPANVSTVLQTGAAPENLIRPFLASDFEVECSMLVYQFYLNEQQHLQKDFQVPDLPTENSRNWMYFYWKARYQHGRKQFWQSLLNFQFALALGGDRYAEVYFCIANSLKALRQLHAAMGYYRQAEQVAPSKATKNAMEQLHLIIEKQAI